MTENQDQESESKNRTEQEGGQPGGRIAGLEASDRAAGLVSWYLESELKAGDRATGLEIGYNRELGRRE